MSSPSVGPIPSRPKTTLPSARTSVRPLARGALFSSPGGPQIREVTRAPAPRMDDAASLRPASQTVAPADPVPDRNNPIPPIPFWDTLPEEAPSKGWGLRAQRLGLVMAVAAALQGGVWLHQHRARGPVVGMPALKSVADGTHVRWPVSSFSLLVDSSLAQLDPDPVAITAAALATWRACGPSIPLGEARPADGLLPGYTPGQSNENAVVYLPGGWPQAGGALAVTVLTFNSDTGAILDADIVINGSSQRSMALLDAGTEAAPGAADVPLEAQSTQLVQKPFDLQSILTHEMGHVLGLGEDVDNPAATMFVSMRPGDTSKRVLASSDAEGVLTLYQQDAAASAGCGSSSQPSIQQKQGDAPALGVLIAPTAMTVAAARRRARALTAGLLIATTVALAAAQSHAPAPSTASGASPASTEPAATGRVKGATVSRSGGMLTTELRVVVEGCASWQRGCVVGSESVVTVAGGTEGKLTQQVGRGAVPATGEPVDLVADRDGRLAPARLVVLGRAP